MTECLIDFFKKHDVEFLRNYNISIASPIAIGGKTTFFVSPDSEEKLIKTIDYLHSLSCKYRIVGRMTNILPNDDDFHGVLISTAKINSYFVAEKHILGSCGIAFSKLIAAAANMSCGGFEGLYGIPGTLGGMTVCNAGAYGAEVSDFLLDARVYSLEQKKISVLTNKELNFSYRDSLLRNSGLVLLSAKLSIPKHDEPQNIKKKLKEVINKRMSSQPMNTKNIGSIFKKHESLSISLLIDRLGLKGFSVGGAQISEKHAGFIINTGCASSKDVKALISMIKNRINEIYGFIPQEEIEIW